MSRTPSKLKMIRDGEAMQRFSNEALQIANERIGNHPGQLEHVRLQKKLRNQMAIDAGFKKFDSSLITQGEAVKQERATKQKKGWTPIEISLAISLRLVS